MSRLPIRLLLPLSFLIACGPAADAPVDDTDDTDVDDTDDTDVDDTDADDTDDTDDTDEPVTACAVTPPATWSAPDWTANTVTALALRAQLDALSGAMRGAEQATVTVDDVADLVALYEAGDPSLADVVTSAFDPVTGEVFAEFVEVALAGPQDLIDGDGFFVGGAAGGVFGTSQRGIGEGGVEVRQLVDKGLFAGAGLYRWAADLTVGEIDAATIDAIAAAWGANATFDTAAGLTDSANYSYPMGYFAPVAGALIDAKAYAASEDCVAERDAALVLAFRGWEESQSARFVFYVNQAAVRMASASSDDDAAEAIHGVSEGLGLALGFAGLPAPASGPLATAGVVLIDDEAIEQSFDALGVDPLDLGGATLGDLVTDPDALQGAAEDLEAILAPIYAWDAAKLTAIRTPTAG